MKIGFKATQIAIAGFVVPFMAVYDPALMMQGDPTWIAVVYIVLKALLAIFLWGCAAIGYLWSPLHMFERVFAAASAALLGRGDSCDRSDWICIGLYVYRVEWVEKP